MEECQTDIRKYTVKVGKTIYDIYATGLFEAKEIVEAKFGKEYRKRVKFYESVV